MVNHATMVNVSPRKTSYIHPDMLLICISDFILQIK